MLKDLKVLNGILDLNFDKYIYEYTVEVDSNVDSLDLEYTLEDEYNIDIRNNNLVDGENIVYLDVYSVDYTYTYTLYVYKNSDKTSSKIDEYKKKLEVINNEKIEIYKVNILCISVFLLIVIIFSILFHKKRKVFK